MKFLKKICMLLLIVLVIFSFSACGTTKAQASPNITDADIIEVVSLELDLNKIVGADDTGVANIKSEIRNIAKIICEEMNLNLNKRIDSQLTDRNIDDDTKKVLASYKNAITFKDLNFKLTGGIIKYEFCVKYADVNLYKYYYNETGENAHSVEEVGNFFYNKVRIVGDETVLKHNEFSTKCKNDINLKFSNIIVNSDDYFIFNLQASKRRLKTNADYSMKLSSDNYLHTWVVDDNAENEIEYYYRIANRSNWILLSVGISLIVLGIMFIISKNLNSNKQEKINKNKLINKIILKNNEKNNKN